ncbi:MAG: chromophore lyase CpcT/CpeT [Phycisphaerales bacterium]|nr:chromophore lyase CpcT/CpeT [Phycisphaerales bacterium]
MPRPRPLSRLFAGALLLAAPAIALNGCASDLHTEGEIHPTPHFVARAEPLAGWMTGSFSNEAQAAEAPDRFAKVQMHIVRIWPERNDGVWMYIEQALAAEPQSPYRQRIYRLTPAEESVFELDTFQLPERARFVGAWRKDEPLADLDPDRVDRLDGCTVVIHADGADSFRGSTIGRGCSSQLSGASYATSHIRISPSRIESWDRGFNARGEQVWGAVDSGYIFDRVD